MRARPTTSRPVMAPARNAAFSAGETPPRAALGHASVRAHGHVHADVAGGAGEQTTDREADRNADVLDRDQRDEEHDADTGDHRVLAVEIGPGALLDGPGDLLHALVARRERQQLAGGQSAIEHGKPRADKRDDDPMVSQEVTQGWVLCGVLSCFAARPIPWPREVRAAEGIACCDAPAKRRGILSANRTESRAGYCPGTHSRPDD